MLSPLDRDFFDLLQRLQPQEKDEPAVGWVLGRMSTLASEYRRSVEKAFYTLHLRSYLRRKLAGADETEEEAVVGNFARAIVALLRKAHGTRTCENHKYVLRALGSADAVISFNYDLVDSHRHTLSTDPKEEAPHLAISVQLNKDTDSPWSQAVNTGGISLSTPGAKRKITLRTFQEANRVLISGPRCQNADYDVKYEAAKNYWQAVATIFSDAWTNSRKHLITKGVGIAALAELGKYIIEECLSSGDTSVTAMAEHLKKLEGFDWGNQTSPLKIVGGQKGAKAAAKMFMAIVFGKKELSDVAELLEA